MKNNNKKIKNVYLGHTLDEYKSMYDIDKNIHIDKKAVDEFNKKHPKASKNSPLDGRLWWLIGDTYYEIDSITPKVKKHKGNKAGIKIALAGVLGGIGIAGALGGGTLLIMKAIGNPTQEEISLNKTKLDLDLFNNERLFVNNLPAGQTVKWKSNNPQTATVDTNGVVKGAGTGTTQIVAIIGERELWCDVTVKMPEPTQDENFKYKYVAATANEEAHYLIYLDRDETIRSTWDKKHIYLPSEYSGLDDTGVAHGTLKITGFYAEDSGSSYRGAFSNCKSLESVIIPEGWTSIDDSTFWMSSITDIIIPNTIKRIGNYAFTATKIKSLVLPESVEQLGALFYGGSSIEEFDFSKTKIDVLSEQTFMACDKLKQVKFNDLITKISKQCFYNCQKLNNIVLPESIIEIGDEAFSLCESLEKINFSEKLVTLTNNPFAGCSSLKEFDVASTNPKYTSHNKNLLIDKTEGKLISFPSASGEIKDTDFPNDLKSFGDGVFARTPITKIALPNGLTSVSAGCFEKCSGLKEVSLSNSITTIEKKAFEDCVALDTLHLNEGLLNIETQAFLECNKLGSVTIPSTVLKLASQSFSGCSSLTSINIPSSVKTIGPNAFFGCDSLTINSVTFPSSTLYTIKRDMEGDTVQNFDPTNDKSLTLYYLKGKWEQGKGLYLYTFTKEEV